MKTSALFIVAILAFAPFGYAQDAETKKQLKEANEAAEKMGVKMPDVQKMLDANASEEAAQKAATKKRHAETVAKYSGKAALPDWAPKVPKFTASGPAAIKTVDGQEKIVVTGTSPLSPNELADAWDTFKNDKFSHERTGSNINGQVSQIVSYSKVENPMDAVRMEAERKSGAKVTKITLSSPVVDPEEGADEHMEEEMSGAGDTSGKGGGSAPPVAMYIKLPAGSAKGTLTYDGATAELKFASAFIDEKDERKPVILLITDQKLPFEKWTSEFDMIGDKTKWTGLAVFIDDEGSVYRTDVHSNGRQSSVSGVFNVKILDTKAKDLSGTATTSEDQKENKLDVTFHAAGK